MNPNQTYTTDQMRSWLQKSNLETHVLIVRMPEEPEMRRYFTTPQARVVTQAIAEPNSRFLVFEEAAETFHKSFCTLRRLGRQEMLHRHGTFFAQMASKQASAKERREQEENRAIEAWIAKNPNTFLGLFEKALAEAKKQMGNSLQPSKQMLENLAKARARAMVADRLSPT